MLDFGWTELLMIGVVAVVVIGPKDLPKAMSSLADWVRKLRGLARDFQGQVDDMVKGTELEDVKKAAQGLNKYNVKRQISSVVDPKGQMKKALEETRSAANARLKETREIASGSENSEKAKPAGALGETASPTVDENSIGGDTSSLALADDATAVATMSGESGADTAAKPAQSGRKSTARTAKGKSSTTARKPKAAKTTTQKTKAVRSSTSARNAAKSKSSTTAKTGANAGKPSTTAKAGKSSTTAKTAKPSTTGKTAKKPTTTAKKPAGRSKSAATRSDTQSSTVAANGSAVTPAKPRKTRSKAVPRAAKPIPSSASTPPAEGDDAGAAIQSD